MTKAEAIRNTEYTERELMELALLCAADKFRKHWHECERDGDVYGMEHYMDLTIAYEAMREEYRR